MTYFAIGCRCLVAAVFLTGLVSKVRGVREFGEFARSLERLGLVPGRRRAVAGGVVGVEAAVVALLVPGRTAPAGLILGAAVLAIFAGGIWRARRAGRSVPCHCFGTSPRPLGWDHVVRNAGLAALCLAGTGAALAPTTAPRIGGVALAMAAGAALAALVVSADHIISLFTPIAVHADPDRRTFG